MPCSGPLRVDWPRSAATSCSTSAPNCCGLAWSSISFQSRARSARTPSLVVQKMSARSRRTLRLSVTRVRPPVPGSTPSSGTSGRLTVDERSSTITMRSQARASS